MLYDMLGRGYTEAVVDGERKSLREQIILSKNKKHEISVVVDSIALDELRNKQTNKDAMTRLAEAIERALEESQGLLEVEILGEKTIMSNKFSCANCGFSFPEIEPRLFSFNSPYGACPTCNGLGTKYFGGLDECEACHGKRLRPEALHVYLDDTSKINIVDIVALSISEAEAYFNNIPLTQKEQEIASVVIKEIQSRLSFMLNVGLNYLALNRKADTLSGGEAQRIRLASQLGSQLVGALYVLDEPTIGLHQRDNDRLIKTLTHLRDIGNTIIIVEHDEDTIFASDYIIDIGPKAGVHGGEVIVSGYLDELLTAPKNKSGSLTLAYLRGEKSIPVPARRQTDKGTIRITGGNISVAQAVIADSTTPENRAKVFGAIGAAFGLGFIFGPFLGGILSSPSVLPFFSASTPFIFSGLLALFNVISIRYFFVESIKHKDVERKIDLWASFKNIANAQKFQAIRMLFLVSFLFNAGFAFFTSFFNVYLTNKFDFSPAQIGNFFAYVGIWIIITHPF
jgi:excinuclease UvrABC ATPase subunit